MNMKSFKDLLLKKAEENSYVGTLIKYAKDEILADMVIESLIKMAEPSAAMGRGANSALTSYAGQMTNTDVEQLRDALGHHISNYKAALNTHHTSKDPAEKSAARNAADQHLSKIVPLMHLAGRASKHSGGKMVLDYRSTTPWESNYTTTSRHDHNNKLKEGTKDLGRRTKGTHPGHDGRSDPTKNIVARTEDHRNVPDFRYLEMAPHAGHPDTERLPSQSGYPFEEIQLGTPAARDAGKAYINIDDKKGPVTQYQEHPFDNHPVLNHMDDKIYDERDDAVKEKYANDLASWKGSPHHQKWLADQKAQYQADPAAYKARGATKAAPMYEGIPLHPSPQHATVAQDESQEAPVEAEEQAEGEVPQAPAKAAKIDTSVPPEGINPGIAKNWDALPEAVRMDIIKNHKVGK